MIKYKLLCKKCSKDFDSWFASSVEYEKLKKTKYLNCPLCNSAEIEKSLMSPSVLSNKIENKKDKSIKISKIKNKLKEYKKFIEKNFDYVGNNFTYEARSIHYNNKKTKKGIYGKASLEEVKELKEEGIETEAITWVNDNDN